jgi:diguanylate cyclase (GGDEF)-like protein
MAGNMAKLRRLVSLASPGGLILFALWALQQDESARATTLRYAFHFCIGSLGAAALLSWYHNYARVLCAAAVAGLTVWCFSRGVPADDISLQAAALLLPLNFALLAMLKERGMVSLDGLLKCVLIAAQIFGVHLLAEERSPTVAGLLRWGKPDAWMPGIAALAFLAAAHLLIALIARRKTNVDAGLLWALAAIFAGLCQWESEGALNLYFGGAGLILMFAVLEHGYDIAYRDELTALPGRRAFNEVLQNLPRRYAIAMCDVDHFKAFNDTYGHDAGDQVLKNVAASLVLAPGGGRAFRYGGEEFVLIFKGRSAEEVKPFVEAVRESIAAMNLDLHPHKEIPPRDGIPLGTGAMHISISIGVADHSAERSSADIVLEAADAALYRAKESGRNCVKIAG